MQIADVQKFSTLDYPDTLSCIVFTFGCNFRCGFCHNPELVIGGDENKIIIEKDFFEFIKSRVGLLEGVVITGGEPTIQKDLIEFIEKIKKLGFLVKLDTNGSNPKMLEKLLKKNLLDYIAMDVKSSIEKYEEVISNKIDTKKIIKSINLIKKSKIDYEFRTTVVPRFHDEEEMEKIGNLISSAKKYVLQKYIPNKYLDPDFENEKSPSDKFLRESKKNLKDKAKKIEIRS